MISPFKDGSICGEESTIRALTQTATYQIGKIACMYHLETGKAVRIFGWIVFVTFLLVGTDRRSRADAPSVGIDTRIPWTTSRIAGSPDPPPPYVTERAFSGLKFSQCLDITSAPGSDRLFVVEQSGKLLSFPNIPDVKTADLVVDFAKEIDGLKAVYALAFHPNFERNRYCYICYIKAKYISSKRNNRNS